MRTLLESDGMEVSTYASVREFLDGFDFRRRSCLLLDMNMPVMGGMGLRNILHEQGSTLPVIVITGGADARLKAQALKAGARAFFKKPVNEDKLLAATADAAAE